MNEKINTKECKFYKKGHCLAHLAILFTDNNKCLNFPNCLYRENQRLKQENAQLKSRLEKG